MDKTQPLTFDQLADIYDKNTQRNARTQPISIVTEWAQSKPGLVRYDKVNDLFYKV